MKGTQGVIGASKREMKAHMRLALVLLIGALVLGACTNARTEPSSAPTWMPKAEVAALDRVGDTVSSPGSATAKVSSSQAISVARAHGPFSDSAPAVSFS